ncbi:MND1-interacting protein 1 [Camellia lanceoleosa]|uniref:MND1-interacting protein 1 n=1 Tax=Camellia lanceoleosa TaxID=1840588 RepID=A0ACC0G4M7_9ERIC|nr:MND1-interacting protein 1 [Camellia lanceoleosa]
MQAARKLSNDLTELKMLRMEREESQREKKGKQTHEGKTMKRLSDMENAQRKASGQVDRANAAVRQLETQNAEIRAEMEASKLNASESVTTCLEVAKREKKCLKRLLAWEKQTNKFRRKLQQRNRRYRSCRNSWFRMSQQKRRLRLRYMKYGTLHEVNHLCQCLSMHRSWQALLQLEKWRQEQKAKELGLVQVEQEQLLKEATETSNKRKHEALRLKIEIDFSVKG